MPGPEGGKTVSEERPVVAFDHHSPEFAADPVGALGSLRATCPVAWSESYGGFWILTRYEDVSDVLSDATTFSSRHDLEPGSAYQGASIPPPPMRFVPLELDPPDFLPYRRLLNPSFSPAAVARQRPLVEKVADWCIDRVKETGRIDFVDDLTSPVPAMVTLPLLGLPIEDWPRHAAAWHGSVAHPPKSPAHAAAVAAQMSIREDLASEVERRRAQPERERSGLIDVCVDAEIDGRPIDQKTLVDIFVLVLAGGVDTTTGAAAGALAYLSEHHDDRRRLIAEPELIGPACEEFLRWITPSPVLGRTVNVATEIGGRCIAKEERVMANLFAANRDPVAFERPEEVAFDRPNNRHAAFGFGIHRCIGANLARMEIQAMINRVLARIPDYEVEANGVERYHTAGIQNGYISVPASFTSFED
jgi:cytochrome P450